MTILLLRIQIRLLIETTLKHEFTNLMRERMKLQLSQHPFSFVRILIMWVLYLSPCYFLYSHIYIIDGAAIEFSSLVIARYSSVLLRGVLFLNFSLEFLTICLSSGSLSSLTLVSPVSHSHGHL